MTNPARTPTEALLLEALDTAIDALNFYAGPNCWGDPNVAQQTEADLRAIVAKANAGITARAGILAAWEPAPQSAKQAKEADNAEKPR